MDARHLSATSLPKRGTQGGLDAAIQRIASQQRHLIRLDQLVGLGMLPRTANARVASRRMFKVHRGVFALHPPPYAEHQRFLAATFACGPRSMLSDMCSARLLGMADAAPLIVDITLTSGRARSRPGITVHRRAIDPRDRSSRHGIPCTSAARTVVDCAHALGEEGTEEMIMAADSSRILNRRRLEELVAECAGRPGVPYIEALIGFESKPARNPNERRMLSICRAFRVAEPLVNHPIRIGSRQFYADFCWPAIRLIVEVDSWRWHGGRLASEHDADRDQVLSMAGWRVVHFTRDQVKFQREETGRRLVVLTSR